MASRELSLCVDLDQGRLVSGFLSTLQGSLPNFVFGDSIPVSFRALKANANNAGNPWTEVDLTGKTVRLAIGTPAGAPTSGTFTLTYGGNTTSELAFDASGATIQAALNALASVIAAGGVTVTKAATGAFRVAFDDVGSRTALTADTTALYPSSGAEIRVAIEGTGSLREVIVARLETQPAAYTELADELPVAAVSIVEIREGGTGIGAINSIDFAVLPYAGSYALTIGAEETAGIAWDSTAEDLQAALEALSTVGADMVTVTGEFPAFLLNFDPTLADIGAITADLTGLVVPTGRAGLLDTNTARMIELLNGASSASATLEIELLDDGDATTWTVLQSACTVVDDVISNSPSAETSGPIYVTVSFLEAQGTDAGINFLAINPAGASEGFIRFMGLSGGSIDLAILPSFPAETSRTIHLPNQDGILETQTVVNDSSPTTGGTVTGAGFVNEFHYLTPAGTLATLTFNLPAAADSRDGQRQQIMSSEIITALTVNAGSGNTMAGAILSAMAVNVSYSFIYSADSDKWIREY